jgi:hypothetical protein
MDITKKLDEIIIKYDLDRDYPLYRKWIEEGRPKNHYYIKRRTIDLGKRDSLDREDERELELLEYYELKNELLNAEEKIPIYGKLFFISLLLRNFLQAEKWIERLKETQNCTFIHAWDEIQKLLEIIKRELKVKSQEHIIMYWMDNITEDETQDMKYIQSRKNHSVYFTEAYAVTPGTHPATNMIFCRINQMFDRGYRSRKINRENSMLLRCLDANGYDVCILSGYLQKLFDETDIVDKMRVKESCSGVYWQLWEEILKRDRPTLFLVHSLVETHYPFVGAYLEKNIASPAYETQRFKMGVQEVDSQIAFYDGAIGKNEYRIYMSDHGDIYFKLRFHVHMQVWHYDWSEERVDSIFSVQDTCSMLEELIGNKTITPKKYEREYAEICDVARYNKEDIKKGIKGKNIYFPQFIGYAGVITSRYYYVRYENGYEWLATKEDPYEEICMFAERPVDDTMIREGRRLSRNIPVEYRNDEKFRYSKYVYQICNNVDKRVREMIAIISSQLASCEDGSIALRMGAWHTVQLYYLLDEKIRRKFGAIIDINEKCACQNMGFPIYAPQTELPDNIKSILLSTYIHLPALREEAKAYYNHYNIIDIYEILQTAGMELEHEFFFGTKDDYDVGFPFDGEFC